MGSTCSPPAFSVPGFSRQEDWSGSQCSSPGNLPQSGIEPGSPALQTDSLSFESPGKPQSGHRRKVFGFDLVCWEAFGTGKWKCIRGSWGERSRLEIEIMGLGEIKQEEL